MSRKETVLVSSCLVGLCTRYDSQTKISAGCMERIGTATWIPVCPEQLGGLPTPRAPADIIGGTGLDVLRGKARVHGKDGTDFSAQFIRGAHQVLEIARGQKISRALLKARSPSCGVTRQGVTAALLLEQGIVLEEFD